MANTKSAAKRARQSERRAQRNSSTKTALKSVHKKLRNALATGEKETAKDQFAVLSSKLDKAAKNGVIHRNAAARRKSRLNKALAAAT